MTAMEMVEKAQLVERPRIKPGDTVRVHVRVKEGDKERIQVFEGVIINLRRGGRAEAGPAHDALREAGIDQARKDRDHVEGHRRRCSTVNFPQRQRSRSPSGALTTILRSARSTVQISSANGIS